MKSKKALNGTKKSGKRAAKAKAAVTAKKANGGGHKKEGIVAFMLKQLQIKPHTVRDLAVAANKAFPNHPVEALTNTARGLLARIAEKGFTKQHDAKAKTYFVVIHPAEK